VNNNQASDVTSGRPLASTVKIVSTVAPAEETAASEKEKEGTSTFGRNTIIAIAVIASCVGGAAAIWTLIRKWKLGPSNKFENRMQPIEWSADFAPGSGEKDAAVLPTAAVAATAETHRRGSTGSHGSFHSNDAHSIGRNVTGNNMFADQNPTALAPEAHDFTAGPAQTYDYQAGYVDLQRSNSGRLAPDVTGATALTHGPSVNHGYEYDYPAGAHGQYEYDNTAYAGAYGQPADLHRGPSMNQGTDAYAAGYDAYPAATAGQDPYAHYNTGAGYGQAPYTQQPRY